MTEAPHIVDAQHSPTPEAVAGAIVAAAPLPLAIDAHELARLLSVSHTTIHAMNTREELPVPLRFGRCLRWNRAEIERWLDAGAPPRHRWEIVKARKSP